jgi:hypothetical protein
MAYGLSTRAPAENAAKNPLVQRALSRASGTWGGYQAWRQLEPEKRLELVERALAAPANDVVDGYPVAL